MSQLHEDLIAIRQSKQITVEDIFDKTRMAVESIEWIENGLLFNTDKNRTYVRSFARSYAKAIGIKEKDIVHALDLQEIGSYAGYLKEVYLPEKKEAIEKIQMAPKVENDAKPEIDTISDSVKEEPAKPPIKESIFKFDEPTTKKISPKPFVIDEETTNESGQKPLKTVSSRDLTSERKKVDWSETNKKINYSVNKKNPLLALSLILFLLILAGGGIYYFVFMQKEVEDITIIDPILSEPYSEQGLSLPSDTLDAPVAPDRSLSPVTALPDTIEIHVFAAYGNLEPFRVRSDTFENRRPYWVPRGQAMRILFIDEISLFNHRDRMLILYNGRVINSFAEENPAEQSVTIRRSQFVNDPSLASFTTDFPAGVSQPTRILERPVIMN
jgi:cytoskeletal protein RodZ